MSCGNGHLEVVKWLWEISGGTIGMDVVIDRCNICDKHPEVVAWLKTIIQ